MIDDCRVEGDFPTFTDFVFSPDVKYGCLRVIDALAEQYAVLLCIPVTGTERQIIN
jgi:hypothetical protein